MQKAVAPALGGPGRHLCMHNFSFQAVVPSAGRLGHFSQEQRRRVLRRSFPALKRRFPLRLARHSNAHFYYVCPASCCQLDISLPPSGCPAATHRFGDRTPFVLEP
eukprot:266801-Chlamydomonas_euryale.AAC.3